MQAMLKKSVSILMLFSALAVMLGHNLIPHHHHDFEHNELAHHQNDGNHHDNDTEDESDGWGHFFSHLQHGSDGQTYLTSHSSTNNFSKKISHFTAVCLSKYVLEQVIVEIRQNAPPYNADYSNSQNFLPSGLRAPPISIV